VGGQSSGVAASGRSSGSSSSSSGSGTGANAPGTSARRSSALRSPCRARNAASLSSIHQRVDKREGAHEHLTAATTMYREMGMGFWLEQTEAELRAPT
jgi:hypothetical protein